MRILDALSMFHAETSTTYARSGDGLLIRRSQVRALVGEPINSASYDAGAIPASRQIGRILDIGPIRPSYTPPMLIGCVLGAALFIVAAVLAEKNALYLPAAVLVAAGVAELVLR